MSDGSIPELLAAWREGGPQAGNQLLSAVYGELRILAVAAMRRERRHHTLTPTALLHEAYLRLEAQKAKNWAGPVHFYASAAFMMRRVLVDHARKHNRGIPTASLTEASAVREGGWPGSQTRLRETDLQALELELRTLQRNDPLLAQIVELRYFAALTITETAALVRMSPASLKRQLAFAKALLREGVERSRATQL